MQARNLQRAFDLARERYLGLGVDVDGALKRLASIPISLHCWQGDDVAGFESAGQSLGGGLAVTGNYPGRARNADELRGDLELAFSLIPGKHRLNLHASYAETGGKKVERNELSPVHFSRWIDWAKGHRLGMDFNPTCFSHPRAADGFTLAHRDKGIRRFWIEHGIVCRQIGAAIGKALGQACVTNVWIPDGSKDMPVDRATPRERLRDSLDQIFAQALNPRHNLDSVEAKLFGIGSESYVVGSHEFYLGYAIQNKKILCLDTGHFHPTEVVSDKISSILTCVDQILLHVSRGVRWDSDHVVILSDELQAIAQEVIRGGYLSRVRIGLDYFDASINRIAAWVIGTRATLKALLCALLEPIKILRTMETEGDFTGRLALLEEVKSMPFGSVWDYYCAQAGVPVAQDWLKPIKSHEEKVLSRRS